MSIRDRVGKITLSGGAVYDLRLATHRDAPYRPSYRLVWPEFQDVPGAEGKVSADPFVRQWHIDEWGGGEGEDLWEPGKYNQSTNVRPKTVGDGLTLGAYREVTVNDAGTPATFTEGRQFGLGQGKLWACSDATVHEWQPSTKNWANAGTATGLAGAATSIVDAMDGTNLLIGSAANEIEKVAPGGANSTLETGLAFDPVLRTFGSTVYCLVGDDLYTVDATTGLSATAVSDLSGQSGQYLSGGRRTYQRLSVSDKGPIWLQRLDSGQTYIWEYNEANDTTTRIGKLPVDFAYPYSIFFAAGYVFVGFRYANDHSEAGAAYIYFQRGLQRGVAGPFRDVSGASAWKAVLMAGIIGDDLMVYYNDALWAYNLSEGGIYQVAKCGVGDPIASAITFGKDAFIANVDNTDYVERLDTAAYSTDTATWRSGRFDFGYLGTNKALLDVTVVHDPLPANTTLTLKVSSNGGAFATVTGTDNVDDVTSFTWTASSSTSTVTGRDFELELTFASTVSTATPTIRSVTVRAMGVQVQRSWIVELDAASYWASSEGRAPASADLLSDGRAVATAGGVVKFTNVWDGDEYDGGTDYDVMVEQAVMVEAEPEGDPYFALQLREVSYA